MSSPIVSQFLYVILYGALLFIHQPKSVISDGQLDVSCNETIKCTDNASCDSSEVCVCNSNFYPNEDLSACRNLENMTLTIVKYSTNTVDLKWVDSVSESSSFVTYSLTVTGISISYNVTNITSSKSVTVSNLDAGHLYHISVHAVFNESYAISKVASEYVLLRPIIPSIWYVAPQITSIKLHWNSTNPTKIVNETKLLTTVTGIARNFTTEIGKEQQEINGLTPGTRVVVELKTLIMRNVNASLNFTSCSGVSSSKNATLMPSKPSSLTFENITKDSLSVVITKGIGSVSSFICDIYQVGITDVLNTSSATSSAPVCYFSGLHPYTNYSVEVVAVSNNLNSTSLTKTVLTDESVPGPPQNHSIVPTSNGVDISWSTPIKSNGVLLGFEINWNVSLTASSQNHTSVNSSTFLLHLPTTEVPSGSQVCIRIRARTSKGFGEWSSVKCLRLDDKKSEKVELLSPITLGTTFLNASWNPPKTTNGVILCYYVLVKQRDDITGLPHNGCLRSIVLEQMDGFCRSNMTTDGQNTLNQTLNNSCQSTKTDSKVLKTTVMIDALKPGKLFQLIIFAANRAGPGSLLYKNDSTKQDISSKVASLESFAVKSRSFGLKWKPPTDPNGLIVMYHIEVYSNSLPITCFNVNCSDCSDRQDFVDISGDGKQKLQILRNKCSKSINDVFNASDLELSVNINNRRPYTSYTFTVWPINGRGPGENRTDTVQTIEDRPSPPRHVQLSNATSEKPLELTVTWESPENENGIITNYSLELSTKPNTVPKSADSRSHTFPPLTACSTYNVTVIANNKAGSSNKSNISTGYTRVVNPANVAQPNLLSPSNTEMRVEWNAIVVGKCKISYEVKLRNTRDNTLITNTTKETSMTFKDLKSYNNYTATLTVHVSEDAFGGATSNTSMESLPHLTKQDVPGQVEILNCLQPRDEYNRLECSWNEPKDRNGIITEYRVKYTVQGKEYINTTTKLKMTISQDIRPDVNILVKVEARTKIGYGTPRELTFTLTAGPPNPVVTNQQLRSVLLNSRSTVSDPNTQIGIAVPCNIFDTLHGNVKEVRVEVRANSSQAKIQPTQMSLGTWKNTNKGLNGPYPATIVPCATDRRRRKRSVGFIPREQILIIIGNGTGDCSSAICNGPLASSTHYEIAIRGFTSHGSLAIGFVVILTESPVPVNVIIPICIGAVLLLIGIIVALMFVWKRRKSHKRGDVPSPESRNDFRLVDMGENLKEPIMKGISSRHPVGELARQAASGADTAIPIDMFPSFVNEMNKDCRLLYTDAFNEVKYRATSMEHDMNLTTDEAGLQSNRLKNRFANILPFDHSRVCLSSDDDPTSGMDYINANYISGHRRRREFIACQGPLAQTLDDFWRMIWEQEVSLIVMLTLCVEKGRNKCEQYWPQEDETRVYGDIAVRLYSQSILPAYAVRLLDVMSGTESRRVTHMQMLTWEDFTAPNAEDLASFMEAVRGQLPVPDNSNDNAPVLDDAGSTEDQAATVVHCSAGVGRTGTFIALDRLTNQVDDGSDIVDINNVIISMRGQRRHMVQSERQYIFIHEFLLHYLTQRPRKRFRSVESPSILIRPANSTLGLNGNAQYEETAFSNNAYKCDNA